LGVNHTLGVDLKEAHRLVMYTGEPVHHRDCHHVAARVLPSGS
jgi:hypothetical protein